MENMQDYTEELLDLTWQYGDVVTELACADSETWEEIDEVDECAYI